MQIACRSPTTVCPQASLGPRCEKHGFIVSPSALFCCCCFPEARFSMPSAAIRTRTAVLHVLLLSLFVSRLNVEFDDFAELRSQRDRLSL